MARVLFLLLIAAALLEPAEGQCTDKWKLKKCTRKALKGKCLATCTTKKCRKTRRKCKGTCNSCDMPLSPPAPPSPPPSSPPPPPSPPCVDDATYFLGYDCAGWAYDCPITDDRAITSFSMCTPSEYSDTCDFAFDGECDDGLVGSLYDSCEAGTDLTDCGMPANGNGVFVGPDNVPCEVQCPMSPRNAPPPSTDVATPPPPSLCRVPMSHAPGWWWGPTTIGYYYSAAEMFAVRYACPASCGMCTDTSLTCADNATYTDPLGYDCAGWAMDCPITDPLTIVAAASCEGPSYFGGFAPTLVGNDGVACEVQRPTSATSDAPALCRALLTSAHPPRNPGGWLRPRWRRQLLQRLVHVRRSLRVPRLLQLYGMLSAGSLSSAFDSVACQRARPSRNRKR